ASSSGCGSLCKNPDLVAPGSHVASLRDPGSSIDLNHSDTGAVDTSLFRGSGTSQAAAVVSGAAALILSRTPTATPDQVKQLLMSTAKKCGGFDTQAQGAGEMQLSKAFTTSMPSHIQKFTAATGTGSLDASRGSGDLVMDGVVLAGEQDILASGFAASAMATLEGQGKSWSGGTWNGRSWSGADWSGKSWSGKTWSGAAWSGKSWSGSSWSGKSWSSGTWTASGWAGTSWSSNNWLAANWSAAVWADASWS
ncbi:MAG TPA: S8 family serine peptidase, partial [Actinomycetota bacterium]|nr:S8 family serine peptidase [Actinomycetota bacterium]